MAQLHQLHGEGLGRGRGFWVCGVRFGVILLTAGGLSVFAVRFSMSGRRTGTLSGIFGCLFGQVAPMLNVRTLCFKILLSDTALFICEPRKRLSYGLRFQPGWRARRLEFWRMDSTAQAHGRKHECYPNRRLGRAKPKPQTSHTRSAMDI